MSHLSQIDRGIRFNRKEAAEYLGVTGGTLAVWATEKRYDLPYYKAGSRVYYWQADLDAFIERRMS